MEEETILRCKQGENVWKCPVESCGKTLSRKQTLKSHIINQHNVEAGNPTKRYKQYGDQDGTAVPRTTQWRLNKRNEKIPSTTDENIELECGMDLSIESADETVYSSDGESLEGMQYLVSESEEWSTDEEEATVTDSEKTSQQNDEPPIYVIPPSNTVYQSHITKSEHSLAVSAFATRHNLSDTAVKDMLQLIQLHLPDQNIAETNTRQLKEACGFDSNYLKHHLYCDVCKKLYDTQEEQCITPGCGGTKSNSQYTNYFITGETDVQLKEILQRDGVWKSIEESRTNLTENISDIRSGMEYRTLQNPGGFLDNTQNITLSLFIDGIPLFKSSSTSLWPVYFLINEIPPRERFSRKNMVLWGIWQGVGKPKMNMFLRPLITDLVHLYEHGISIMYNPDLPELNIKAMLIVATMDLQARSYVLMMTMHNGENGCLYCMNKGKVVTSGKGHCRAYLPEDQAEARSDEILRQNAIDARQTGRKVQGVLGQSVLWYLPYFSFTKNVVIDYMHGTLLGVTKKMLELWFDKTHASEPFNICGKMMDVDKDLRNIKPLYLIHRLPRILTNTYNNWKASELRNWLLFYSLPCLKGKLPDLYITHFSCLSESIYILLQEGITNEDLQRADMLLQTYASNVQQLYGDRFMSMNVHNLTHLTGFVKSWGPLWAWSCFCFESFNGEIKKSIHGTGNVCKQIFWTLQAQKRVESKAKQLPKESRVRLFMENVLECKSVRFPDNSEAYKCSVIKVSNLQVEELSEEVKMQLTEHTGANNETDFVSVSKIARNGFVMYSKMCTKVKKQNSYTIQLEKKINTYERATAIEVNRYVMERESRKVFAVGRLVVSSGSVLPRRVNHLQKIDFLGEDYNAVVPADYLREPLMVVATREEVFAAVLPNHIERD